MVTRTEKDFELFMSQLKETTISLDFYTNFHKCYSNIQAIEIHLNALNFLLGKKNIKEAVCSLWEDNPKVFSVLPILIAVRPEDHKMALNKDGELLLLSQYLESSDKVLEFIDGTGLNTVFCNHQIKNLVDYVFGVEVGLDTNARKNRSGHIMEGIIAQKLNSEAISFEQEVYSTDFPEVANKLGEDIKRFDFVVKTKTKTYLIEVNFYSGQGSKLNETARSYTELSPKINSCEGFEFVWITDGKGWYGAKNKLNEAFYTIPRIYNLTTLDDFIKELKQSL